MGQSSVHTSAAMVEGVDVPVSSPGSQSRGNPVLCPAFLLSQQFPLCLQVHGSAMGRP